MNRTLVIPTPNGQLHGQLALPEHPRGLILLARAHHVADDAMIAANLAGRGYAILNMELLTASEAQLPDATLNVPRLNQRLLDIIDLIRNDGDLQDLPLGILAHGDSTPAAVRTAAQRDTQVKVLACHGGFIDRAGVQALELLVAPLLILFDEDDHLAEAAFRRAVIHLHGVREEHILRPSQDPILRIAAWFSQHLPG